MATPKHGLNQEVTHTIELTGIPDQIVRLLDARSGGDRAGYLRDLIIRHFQKSSSSDEILAPFRRQVQESGMTEAELDTFFEEVRQEVWDETHKRGKLS